MAQTIEKLEGVFIPQCNIAIKKRTRDHLSVYAAELVAKMHGWPTMDRKNALLPQTVYQHSQTSDYTGKNL